MLPDERDVTADGFRIERVFKGPGFAETLYLGTMENRRIIRKVSNPDAHGFSRIALVREIRLLADLPPEISSRFAELIRTNLGGLPENDPRLPATIFYDMPYYAPGDGWTTLSRALLEGSLPAKEARRLLGGIVDAAFDWFRIDERTPAPDYAERTMLRAIRESIDWAWKEPDFRRLFEAGPLTINGRRVANIPDIEGFLRDTPEMRRLLTPPRDRFLHGDFFPENILCNTSTGRWLLLDPVSVRGVCRGDFMLDVDKMDQWLSGELPALRTGRFDLNIDGSVVSFTLHTESCGLAGLAGWYRERLGDARYRDVYESEPGWERRRSFIKAFYAFCMLPLADRRQAVARYLMALMAMDDFIAGG